jgi:hypothetical protein
MLILHTTKKSKSTISTEHRRKISVQLPLFFCGAADKASALPKFLPHSVFLFELIGILNILCENFNTRLDFWNRKFLLFASLDFNSQKSKTEGSGTCIEKFTPSKTVHLNCVILCFNL